MTQMPLGERDQMIRDHYRVVAETFGASGQSTMEDEIVREKELQQIHRFVEAVGRLEGPKQLRILDLGCGNGYALSSLSAAFPNHEYCGSDFSDELLSIAKDRGLAGCIFRQADARSLPFDDDRFDAVYTERCLINIMNWEQQRQALSEIARVLRHGGYYLAIECFTDGLHNNNKARQECGLDEISAAYHNLYFEKDQFFKAVAESFTVVDSDQFRCPSDTHQWSSNFLSSHYFIARVLHPLITRGPAVKNTEFVKFFSFLPPIGNYSPIQSYVLQKK